MSWVFDRAASLASSRPGTSAGVSALRAVWAAIDCTLARVFLTRWFSSLSRTRVRRSFCLRSVMSRMLTSTACTWPSEPRTGARLRSQVLCTPGRAAVSPVTSRSERLTPVRNTSCRGPAAWSAMPGETS